MSSIATAVVGGAVIGGYMSSKAQKSAAKSASKAQIESSEASVAEQKRQFDKLQELLAPYVAAGTGGTDLQGSLTAQQQLLGLRGAEAQRQAIDAIAQGPEMAALIAQGENAILQNASATGGLRGGNVQAALGQFRPQILNQLIDQQYERLGGLTRIGQASAAGTGAAGMESANMISNLLAQQGAAQAGKAIAGGQAQAQFWGGINNSIGTLATLKALGGF